MPLSTMQDYPLTLRPILEHGRTVHATSKVITFTGDGYVESTFAEVADRADQLAAALTRLGVRRRRPRRHVHVEQPGAPRGVPRGAVHGRGAAHAEHPPVPRAAGLRHQPRRGPGDHRRRLDRPAARQGPRPADDRRAHHRHGRRRHVGARRDAGLRRRCSPPSSPASTGPRSTSAPAWRCATRAAPPATRRAWCTAIAPRTCTR